MTVFPHQSILAFRFVATGLSALPPSGEVSQNRRGSRFARGRRVSYGRQSSDSPREGSEQQAPAFSARNSSTEGQRVGAGDGGAAEGKRACSGLKYIGTLTDGFSEEAVEIYLGSFHQQALISEAKRVLYQPQNRGLGMELVAGVAAVGVGRNSIGAIVTTSRPYKKVCAAIVWSFTLDKKVVLHCEVVVQPRASVSEGAIEKTRALHVAGHYREWLLCKRVSRA